MMCLRCGLQKSGRDDFFVCDDCIEFSKIVQEIYSEVNEKISTAEVIDPTTDRSLALIADASFISAKNPQTSIFTKMSELIIQKAYGGEFEITEEELNRTIRTTRGWADALKLFKELDLINVRMDEHQRILELTEKTKKMSRQYDNGEPLSEQIKTRHAHIYSGYVLMYILNNVSYLEESNLNEVFIPYKQKPKTLWNALMFLWKIAYNGQDEFSEEDFRKFLSKRRIPSTIRGQIIVGLQAMSGSTVQTLIKEVSTKNNQINFKFNDYVIIEMRRIRDNRERIR